MDDLLIFWPKHLGFNIFSIYLNNFHPPSKCTFVKAKVIVQNLESCLVVNFLDVSVILHSDRSIETDIYYKNTHDYLPYDSAQPGHSRDMSRTI